MIDKNIKRMLLFVTLCVLFIGIVSAADVDSSNSTSTGTSISEKIDVATKVVSEIKDKVMTNSEKISNKNNNSDVKTVPKKSKTKINLIVPNVSVNKSFVVMGTFNTVNKTPVKNANLKVNIDGKNYKTKTGSLGEFYGVYSVKTFGTKTVKVSFAGNSSYAAASAKKTINVQAKYPTKIVLNKIKTADLGDKVTISGRYYYNNSKPLKYQSMVILVNTDQRAFVKTDKNGNFKYTYKTVKTGTNRAVVLYAGTTKYLPAMAYTKFNVKTSYPQPTSIKLNSISNTELGKTVTISGFYTYGKSQPLRQTSLVVDVNGQKAYAKTDNRGYFRYTYRTSVPGNNNVTVSYPGTARFKGASVSKLFYVQATGQQPTYIKLNKINNMEVGNSFIVSGYYTYGQSLPLRQTSVLINYNGQKVYAKTNNNGYFSCTFQATKTGVNKVTASYAGTERFQAASESKYFVVSNSTKILSAPDATKLLDNVNTTKVIDDAYSMAKDVVKKVDQAVYQFD